MNGETGRNAAYENYEGLPVFCYAYRPMRYCNGPDDGGFAVNILDSGTVIYTRRDARNRIVEEQGFQIPAQILDKYYFLVTRGRSWLENMPIHMADGPEPAFISMVGLNGYANLYRMDDLPRLNNCEFGSARGHYARLMFNLLEEVAGMLRACGFVMTLNSFTWDVSRVQSLPRPRRRRMFAM